MRTRAAIILVLTAFFSCFFPMTQAGAGGGACTYGIPGEGFTDAEGTKVAMVEACFSPTVIRVATGDTVTFTNKDKMVHAVGGAVGSFGDAHAEIRWGESVSYRFDEEGTFPYVCIFHPGMVGAVVVGDGEGPAFEAGATSRSSSHGDRGSSEGTRAVTSGSDTAFPWLAALALAAVAGAGGATLLGARRRRAGASPTGV